MKSHIRLEDQIGELRRKAILDAATQVFSEKGFRKATIKDIARVAGLADGTIYNYFGNKRELFIAIIESINNPLVAELEQTPGIGQSETLIHFLVAYGHRFVTENRQLLTALVAEVLLDAELQQTFYERIVSPRLALLERYIRATPAYHGLSDEQVTIMTRTLFGAVMANLILSMPDHNADTNAVNPLVTSELIAWFSERHTSES